MSAALAISPTDKLSGARAFARSLNILLKHVRLYGLNHKRSSDQFDQAWELLRSVTGANGFLLGITGEKLLLDGVPLECGPAEQNFAKMLAAAGIASIHFSGSVTAIDFQGLVTTFATSRNSELLTNLQNMANESASKGVRVNEVRFVAHDSANGEPSTVAGAISARAISELGPQVTDWIKDPRKLLQLISAAEGTKGGHGDGTGTGTGTSNGIATGGEPGTGTGPGMGTGSSSFQFEIAPASDMQFTPLHEEEVVAVIRFMQRMGTLKDDGTPPDTAVVHQELTQLTGNAHAVLYQMLFTSVANSFEGQEAPDLLKLAEHLAIRFAVESYERGEVKINAVQQMMDRLNHELDTLNKVLYAHEDKMSRAGMVVESYAEILDRQFWSAIPEFGKRSVLLSADGYCIPARNVRSYVDQLIERRDMDTATDILKNYLGTIESKDIEARRKVAAGLMELADLYGFVNHGFLQQAILKVGRQLANEPSLELQSMLSAAFVRLNQEAGSKRDYVAIEQSMCSLARIEKELPNLARDIKPRVSVQTRLRDFVAEAQYSDKLPQGLVDVLRRIPAPAAEEIAMQFSRCSTRQEAERFVELTKQVGSPALSHLKHLLVERSATEGVIGVGLLTRFDLELLLNELPNRMRIWPRLQQDAAVRQIAASGATQRGELLLSLLGQLDPLILPEAIDEIGLAGDANNAVPLLELAESKPGTGITPYVQLKSVEAIGRLRVASAEALLSDIVLHRSIIGFSHPRELRVAAMQALQSINPEHASHVLTKSGLQKEELSIGPLEATDSGWVRQRRYQRVVPNSTITATAITAKGRCQVALERISLGGGFATRAGRALFGNDAWLEMNTGFRQLKSRVIIREAPAGVMFEIADIGLEERSRLRKLIASQMR
jgi:hypothetical protein